METSHWSTRVVETGLYTTYCSRSSSQCLYTDKPATNWHIFTSCSVDTDFSSFAVNCNKKRFLRKFCWKLSSVTKRQRQMWLFDTSTINTWPRSDFRLVSKQQRQNYISELYWSQAYNKVHSILPTKLYHVNKYLTLFCLSYVKYAFDYGFWLYYKLRHVWCVPSACIAA